MKYCSHCGKQLLDEAVICPGCGCSVSTAANADTNALVHKLSEKVKTNGIIWLVIGILQVLGGLWLNWLILIVGVLNIISSIKDITYSKKLQTNPGGIVSKFEPLIGPIITLIYNLVIGGVIGVIGSIYYLVAVRGFVMENKAFFTAFG